MGRADFTKKTQRAAWELSGERCMAMGEIYGFEPGVRCNADLNLGVEYDHIDPDANSKDASLENCAAVCIKCHRWKTSNRDRPLIAKTDHQWDSHRNIKPKGYRKMKGGSSFRRGSPNVKQLDEL